MTLDAPEAHTTHVLLEMVAKILGRISELTANEVPGALLDAAVTDGPSSSGNPRPRWYSSAPEMPGV